MKSLTFSHWFSMCLLAFISFMLWFSVHGSAKRERELREEVYPAWVAYNPNADITYEQWRILYERNLLNPHRK